MSSVPLCRILQHRTIALQMNGARRGGKCEWCHNSRAFAWSDGRILRKSSRIVTHSPTSKWAVPSRLWGFVNCATGRHNVLLHAAAFKDVILNVFK